MSALFPEIVRLCGDESFLYSVMKKYHYPEDELPALLQVAEEMQPLLVSDGCWAHQLQEDLSEQGEPFAAVAITLGRGVDALQDRYSAGEALSESYMIEVLSSELLLESYRSYRNWVKQQLPWHVARFYFLGSCCGDPKMDERLSLAKLPKVLSRLQLPITCNDAFCMVPRKSVAFYAKLTRDESVNCAGICLGCGRRDCPNRMEEKEDFPLRFADMTDRPLPYGYTRIWWKP